MNMAKNEPRLPPRNESNKRTNSEILYPPRVALLLSNPNSKKLKVEIASI